jgi:hypothetical protein
MCHGIRDDIQDLILVSGLGWADRLLVRTRSNGEIWWILPPPVGSSFRKKKSHGKCWDDPGKQENMCHVARDNIRALILELGRGGWIDPSSDTRSDGEMWWILPCRVGSWDKTGKSWTTGVTESDPCWADGRMVGYMFG